MPVSTPQPIIILANSGSGAYTINQVEDRATTEALGAIQSQIDRIAQALAQPLQISDPLQITDSAGNLVAELGAIVDQTSNSGFSGIWANNAWFGGSGPSTAVVEINGATAQITISSNGITTTLNNATDATTTFPTSLHSQDNATGKYSAITPQGLFIVSAGGTSILAFIDQTGTAAQASLTSPNLAHTLLFVAGNGGPVIQVDGVGGLTTTKNFGTSLTVNTDAAAVKGTPGTGQSNFTAVTGVTLNLGSIGMSAGIVTS